MQGQVGVFIFRQVREVHLVNSYAVRVEDPLNLRGLLKVVRIAWYQIGVEVAISSGRRSTLIRLTTPR